MAQPYEFLDAVERGLAAGPPKSLMGPASDGRQNASGVRSGQIVYGYPVKGSKELGLDDYFKSRPDVSGMAWGGGLNGSDPKEPRSVVFNPYSPAMSDDSKRDTLFKNEAIRHLMAEKPVAGFPITPELQKWREKSFTNQDPYLKDDAAFRETVVARIATGDPGPEGDMPFTPEAVAAAAAYEKLLGTRKQTTGKTNQ